MSFEKRPIIILAGGFGSRLQSILKGLPKPLANINGRPFLYFLLHNLISQGFCDLIFSLHFEANLIIEFLDEFKKSISDDIRIRYIIEPHALGTGGAISFINLNLKLPNEFFIINADTWVDSDYNKLDQTNFNNIGIIKVENSSRYGRVIIDENNLISTFAEKSKNCEKGYVNSGIYKLSKNLFEQWDGAPYSIEKDLFPKLVNRKLLYGINLNCEFIDIGIPVDYYKFCSYIKKNGFK